MKQFAAIVKETFLEAIANRVLLGFLIIAGLALLIVALVLHFTGVADTISRLQPTPDFPDDAALKEFTREWLSRIAFVFYSAVVLISTFITAGFVPGMMQKGIIDLYLSKPIRRSTLLFGKVTGGLAVVLVCMVFFILASWVIVSTATGIWNSDYLLSLVPIIVSFTGMYAILVFVGVQSQSTALSMIVVYVLAIVVSPILFGRSALIEDYLSSGVWRILLDSLYYVVPQVQDCSEISINIIQNKSITNSIPLVQPLGVALVFFVLSARAFSKKEF